jgi:hypothetical protein
MLRTCIERSHRLWGPSKAEHVVRCYNQRGIRRL